jgi:hypothetical protein
MFLIINNRSRINLFIPSCTEATGVIYGITLANTLLNKVVFVVDFKVAIPLASCIQIYIFIPPSNLD